MTTHTLAASGKPAVKNKGPSKLRRRNILFGWSFILPNFLGFAVFSLIPVLVLFYIAFTEWSAFGAPHFNGLTNFQRMLHDDRFWVSLKNTAYYSVFHIPLTLACSLGLALLLNQKLRFRPFFRAAAFFPYFTSIVAIAQVWNMLFSPDYGPINQFLHFIGFTDVPGWTTSTTWAMPAIIIVGTWREMGYYMLLFLAGLQSIPTSLYEAARVDGASAWQRFWYVTIPGLKNTTFFVTVMLTIASLKVLDLILVMTQGGPGTSTMVLSQYIYKAGFEQNQFGYASAVSIVLFLICMTITVAQFMFVRKKED